MMPMMAALTQMVVATKAISNSELVVNWCHAMQNTFYTFCSSSPGPRSLRIADICALTIVFGPSYGLALGTWDHLDLR